MTDAEKDAIFDLCYYERIRADELNKINQAAGGYCDTPSGRNAAEQDAICFTLECRLLKRLQLEGEYKEYLRGRGYYDR